MKIFDTHAHYDDERYAEDLDLVIKDNYNNGVKKIVNASYDLESSIKSKELADKYDNVYYAVGIHPEGVRGEVDEDVQEIERMINEYNENIKLVAIGEIGLDYHYTKENKELQKEYLVKQLELAIKYELPVIIHCRDASDDMFHILNDEKYKELSVVFHCFQPTDAIANLVIKRRWMIGLGGNITYKRSKHSLELIKLMPLDQIMVETDAPYLTPEPLRGTRNESRNIKYVIEKLADIKDVDVETLQDILYDNSLKFYRIK